jgi:hypothetical protein
VGPLAGLHAPSPSSTLPPGSPAPGSRRSLSIGSRSDRHARHHAVARAAPGAPRRVRRLLMGWREIIRDPGRPTSTGGATRSEDGA